MKMKETFFTLNLRMTSTEIRRMSILRTFFVSFFVSLDKCFAPSQMFFLLFIRYYTKLLPIAVVLL